MITPTNLVRNDSLSYTNWKKTDNRIFSYIDKVVYLTKRKRKQAKGEKEPWLASAATLRITSVKHNSLNKQRRKRLLVFFVSTQYAGLR